VHTPALPSRYCCCAAEILTYLLSPSCSLPLPLSPALARRYPGLSHVSLVSHEAPEDADPLLLGAWRSSVQ
jgi:hypothetical protein